MIQVLNLKLKPHSYSLKTYQKRGLFTDRTRFMTMKKKGTNTSIKPKELASHLRRQGLSVKSQSIRPYSSSRSINRFPSHRMLSVASGRKKNQKNLNGEIKKLS